MSANESLAEKLRREWALEKLRRIEQLKEKQLENEKYLVYSKAARVAYVQFFEDIEKYGVKEAARMYYEKMTLIR